MLAPSLKITHLKTSCAHETGQPINRYWFKWSDRKNLADQELVIELLDDHGSVLIKTSVQLQGVKPTGTVDGSPTYDGFSWFYVDDKLRKSPT